MNFSEDELLKELQATFRTEAAEHLEAISSGLLALEKSTTPEAQRTLVETVFRAAHSLKGAARSVDFIKIETQCQSLEDIFASWQRQGRAPAQSVFDKVHRSLNDIESALDETKAARAPSSDRLPKSTVPPISAPEHWMSSAASSKVVLPVLNEPETQTLHSTSTPIPQSEPRAASTEDTVRISVAKLDARLVEAEEMLAAKLTVGQRAEDLQRLLQRLEAWRMEWALIEPEVHILRQASDRPISSALNSKPLGLVRLLNFMDWNLEQFKSLESEVGALIQNAEQDRHLVGKLVDDLMEDSKKLLLLPFGTIAAQLMKLVRDLCRDLGKQADLHIQGENVEIDKRILEEMKDPLIHLLRNCLDHGIEPSDLRIRNGKFARATIALTVTQVNGNKVEIRVSDDGAGIDVQKVIASAVKQGFLAEGDAATKDFSAAQKLIFKPEVTTSPIITRLSGRGLGLAIVRERAEKLGGTVTVDSVPGQGTQFRIMLPSMLATFRGVIVEAEGRIFVVPTAQVERVMRVNSDDIQTVEGRETVVLNGSVLARVRLADVLELPVSRADKPSVAEPTLVLGLGDQRIAFMVDAVLDEQEVLVKPLRKPLARVRNISGATVLASGQVAPILNVADLLKSARHAARQSSGAPLRPAQATRLAAAETKSILAADDSATSRMLIKNMLESAGYKVRTAVDGMEAYTLLRTEKFDLLVSDVEMPRLNGFDLAARIRADKKLAELPIVLVTALESREDRERGIDVGANAYIIKSSFDQSNLLDAVRRLV